ncbi:hypothetical protein PCANC_16803 [Puccinia coronata f. sp. avenae]|uniref:Uncharacterized protein n=1 Tax=Puccinia coronata f. sp. avenae TaxID=200324 RepID=A0A2N5UNZ7_9BASI|nr:hypothetical protein PCANC_16803 [Puccinia coronata f. sp. avenae]
MAPDHDQKGRNAGASLTLGCGVSAPVLLMASFVAPASGRVTGADFSTAPMKQTYRPSRVYSLLDDR